MNDDRRLQAHVQEELDRLPRITADDLEQFAYGLAAVFVALIVFVALTARDVPR